MSTSNERKERTPLASSAKALTDLLASTIRSSGLSVESVATKAGMSRQYLHDIMIGQANPTIDIIAKAFEAAGTPLDRALNDIALYGRDKAFHDRVQAILNRKGSRAVAIRVVVDSQDGDGM